MTDHTMAKIKFHCEHCGKKVSAPLETGGKRGKCPFCDQRCYIPLPSDQIEDINLAPEDPAEERRKQRLRQEALDVHSELLAEQGDSAPPPPPADRATLEEMIRQYFLHMVRGELPAAEKLADAIAKQGETAVDVIDDLAMRGITHPDLEAVPSNVIAGFFRQLRKSIES